MGSNWFSLKMLQRKTNDGSYIYEVIINDKVEHSVINTKPRVFENVVAAFSSMESDWKAAKAQYKNLSLKSDSLGNVQTTQTTTTTTQTTTTKITGTSFNTVGTTGLQEHNKYRDLHQNTPMMTLDADAMATAQKIANQLAPIGKLIHSERGDRNNYGENLGLTTASSPEQAVEKVVKSWYDEIDFYDFAKPSYRGPNGEALGHFTQLVWKASTKLGIGVSEAKYESGG